MKSLEATEIEAIDASASRSERLWRHIPVLGWAMAHMMWNERTRPIVKRVERELRSRPKPSVKVWGENTERVALAQFVCAVAKEEMGWPNDHFIPDDAALVVFWAHNDGLDIEDAVMEIENHLGIKLPIEEVEGWFTQTLGEVIDSLLKHQQTLQHHENVWPPAPTYPSA